MNDRTLTQNMLSKRLVNILRLPRLLTAVAFLCGVAAWIRFLDLDLVLSHYDAKAHLVVARRVIDNLTPGWQQIGAVWLPLPHLLQKNKISEK